MTVKERVDAIISASGKEDWEIASAIGISSRMFTARRNAGSFTAEQFFDICEFCGVDAKMYMKKSGVNVLDRAERMNRHIRRMVDGIVYDTEHAVSFSNNFGSDGPEMELFRDDDGNYFFAEYLGKNSDKIIPCDATEASLFIEQHGTRYRES